MLEPEETPALFFMLTAGKYVLVQPFLGAIVDVWVVVGIRVNDMIDAVEEHAVFLGWQRKSRIRS